MKKMTLIIIIVGLLLLSSTNVLAAWSQGYDGVSYYTTNGNCAFGDRAGAQYVQNLHDRLRDYGIANAGSVYKDNLAWESDLTSGFADSKQFFAFAGHGLDSSTSIGQSTAHFYTMNSSSIFHTNEYAGAANASWDEIRWGNNQMRWATMYNCNFLRNGGSTTNEQNIQKMFEGLRLMMGFASRMYLDSREASTYSYGIGMGWTIKTAFFTGAESYQPQLGAGHGWPNANQVVARVKGYTSAGNNDIYTSTGAKAPRWIDQPSSFSTWDDVISL
ncbi:MAG: DUF6345 domain-containing protein [Thermincola sp.]|jgi:hypothetical protein|nr:DUF6345 domain-containing protein [Thermincola sp.]MDT3704322.1 DUF6345 domain-containing protein [Thermincola sp.]